MVPVGQCADVLDKVGRFADLEVDSEHAQVDGEPVQGVGAGVEYTGALVHCLHQPDRRWATVPAGTCRVTRA